MNGCLQACAISEHHQCVRGVASPLLPLLSLIVIAVILRVARTSLSVQVSACVPDTEL
jgi:hypothetical protein